MYTEHAIYRSHIDLLVGAWAGSSHCLFSYSKPQSFFLCNSGLGAGDSTMSCLLWVYVASITLLMEAFELSGEKRKRQTKLILSIKWWIWNSTWASATVSTQTHPMFSFVKQMCLL